MLLEIFHAKISCGYNIEEWKISNSTIIIRKHGLKSWGKLSHIKVLVK